VSISQLEPTPKGKDSYARELYSEPPLVVEGFDKYEIEYLVDRKCDDTKASRIGHTQYVDSK
jgi:hypothetical protein